MTKILVVEDEAKVAAFIKKGLEENLFAVDIAEDGSIGQKMVMARDYDLAILDVNLPRKSGLELCSEIRKYRVDMPVLLLTALDTTEDKLRGFESGADDYLVKPFEFRELLARIKALMKRAPVNKAASRILGIADLEMNLDTKTVRRSGKKIDLTPKEFSVLEYLLRNKGKVISRVEIAQKVWDIHFDTGTNVIDVYVNFLRKKIDKDFSARLLHTQVGMGYILKENDD